MIECPQCQRMFEPPEQCECGYEHQCGGPKEACEIPGCPECGTPKTPWSKNCENWIRRMGRFRVTTKGDELKGRMLNDDSDIVKVYLSAKELRDISSACLEIAAHLEENISKATQPNAQITGPKDPLH